MKFLAQIPIFHIFQQKESFWKSVEYLWWYSIFSDTVYSLEVGKFQIFPFVKFSPYHCKTKIAAPMKFLAQIPIFHIFQRMESFWKSVEYLWWYSIFSDTSVQLESGKFQIFSTRKKFSPCHCKTKIAALHEIFGPKYLFSSSFSRRKVFENRLNTFGDIAFFLAQCAAWNWEISNFPFVIVFTLPLQN